MEVFFLKAHVSQIKRNVIKISDDFKLPEISE